MQFGLRKIFLAMVLVALSLWPIPALGAFGIPISIILGLGCIAQVVESYVHGESAKVWVALVFVSLAALTLIVFIGILGFRPP